MTTQVFAPSRGLLGLADHLFSAIESFFAEIAALDAAGKSVEPFGL